MRGCIRRREDRSTWELTCELGNQPAQRCTVCGRRFWVERTRHEACPKCGGALVERSERRQRVQGGFATKKAAQAELTEILTSLGRGTYVEPAKITVASFLNDEWLPAIKHTVRPSTYLSYSGHVERHIIPALGSVLLQKLTAAHINAMYSRLLTRDGEDGPALSPATACRIHATLHKACRDAVRWSRVPRNPVDAADPPRAKSATAPELHVWSTSELQTFLAAFRDDRLYAMWVLFAMTGMRRGEVAGLRWKDVDLEAGRVSVQQARVTVGYAVQVAEPKTARGRRSISLGPETTAVLKAWRTRQKEERMEWGPIYQVSDLVFTRENGEAWHPNRLTKLFESAIAAVQKAQRKAAAERKQKNVQVLPRIRLHDLRHTSATLALAGGEHPKVVSDRLGHSTIGLTLDTYSHVLPNMQEEAAARMDAQVFGG